MIQSALIARLKTITSNVYANVSPSKHSLPAITVDLDGSNRQRHYGANGYATGLIDTDFEISVWSANAAGAYNLAQSVISSLENFSGPLAGGDSPITLYSVGDIEILGENSAFDGETQIYQYSIFITITHTLAS
jgi:hypothetical protein